MLDEFISLSQRGDALWISDVRRAFAAEPDAYRAVIRLECLDGTLRDYSCLLPHWENAAGRDFLAEYLTARIFNILSCFSGRALHVYLDLSAEEPRRLAEDCLATFTATPGLKILQNIARRLCGSMGLPPFGMDVRDINDYAPAPPREAPASSVSLNERLLAAIEAGGRGAYCGMDVGGTDIKLAAALDGRLLAVKEYDWNPAASPTADGITEPMLMLARLMRACVIADSLPKDHSALAVLAAALRKDADDEEIRTAIFACEGAAAGLPLFDGLGLSFPDIVIGSRILGGETPKTKAMRENPDVDYETEFAKLSHVSESLAALCRPGVRVRIINDGPMAAFSAAAALAADGTELTHGVVAYALGTDLGSGWIDARGDIPEIPLELYDLLLDLGSAPWKRVPPEDIRSVRNENSGLPGVRRYLGQAATYRLAQELQPSLLDGLTEESDGVIRIKTAPQDMRKPALERLMTAAADGNEAAREIFRRIGSNLAALTEEMEYLLSTGTDSRYIFGRFAKIPGCFALIREGFGSVLPGMKLIAADDGLACSGLMRQLARLEGVTVAQFAQAVSAIYYSCMN